MIESFGHVLKSLFVPVCFPIRKGPLKGFKWIAVSGSKFVRGAYEPRQTAVFAECVNEGDVILDVGAHVGYYTALASRLAGVRGRVFAFEPRPINLRFLRRHVRINRLDNVTIVNACVGEASGEARFETRTGTGTGRLSNEGNLSVKLVSLDDLFRRGELPKPTLIKVDVEGAEQRVLAGAEEVIKTARPILLISTHGPGNHQAVTRFLESHGYTYEVIEDKGSGGDNALIARPSST